MQPIVCAAATCSQPQHQLHIPQNKYEIHVIKRTSKNKMPSLRTSLSSSTLPSVGSCDYKYGQSAQESLLEKLYPRGSESNRKMGQRNCGWCVVMRERGEQHEPIIRRVPSKIGVVRKYMALKGPFHNQLVSLSSSSHTPVRVIRW
jgi:hypothetical protein